MTALRLIHRDVINGVMDRLYERGIYGYRSWAWGLMWRTPEFDLPERLSYEIVLPNGRLWNTNDKASLPPHGLWDVTGVAPKITVKPSIDAVGSWHGWITEGVVA